MASPEGIFAAVHAGWRGLVAGVVEAAAGAMSDLGATSVVGALGPCIHPCCYEFSEPDLARLAAALGSAVRGRTADGRPALDLPAAASAAMARAGVKEVGGVDRCTGCGGGLFSHRVRAGGGAPGAGRLARPRRGRPMTGEASASDTTVEAVARRLAALRERIERAAPDPPSVTVVAVTKGFGPAPAAAAFAAGIDDLGENYARS